MRILPKGCQVQACSRDLKHNRQPNAGVVELVDAPDSKSGSERSVGSSPTTRTTSQDFHDIMSMITAISGQGSSYLAR